MCTSEDGKAGGYTQTLEGNTCPASLGAGILFFRSKGCFPLSCACVFKHYHVVKGPDFSF